MSNETLLYGFTVTDQAGAHRLCIDEHCLSKGVGDTGACMTVQIAKFLSLRKSLPLSQTSDWALLNKALKTPDDTTHRKVLKEFAKRLNSYGLRYSNHLYLGKEFVVQLLNSYKSFFMWNEPLWEKDLSSDRIFHYRNQFLNLCVSCEQSNPGEIYRLYDLLKGKEALPSKFEIQELLSLLFAFGHANPNSSKTFPQSIGELISKYEFFYEFAKEAIEFTKKYLGFSASAHANYLKSAASFVNKLWNVYSSVSSQTFKIDRNVMQNAQLQNVQNQLINGKSGFSEDDQTIIQLRAAFSNAIQQKSLTFNQIQKSSLSFKSNFEATYHPFKHGDSSDFFLQRKRTSVFDDNWISDSDLFKYVKKSVEDYLFMIKELMSQGKVVKIQPNQFNSGTLFKFQQEQIYNNKKTPYGVLVQCHPGGISYLLTCY